LFDVLDPPVITSIKTTDNFSISSIEGNQEIKILGAYFYNFVGDELKLFINDIDVTSNIISINLNEIILSTIKTNSGPATVRIVTLGGQYKNYDENQIISNELITFAGNPTIIQLDTPGVPANIESSIIITGTEFYGDVQVWLADEIDDYKGILKNIQVVNSTTITATVVPISYVGSFVLVVKTPIGIAINKLIFSDIPEITYISDLNDKQISTSNIGSVEPIYIIGNNLSLIHI
jgi:hypothetical protein